MNWFTMPLNAVPMVLLSTLGIYVAVILFTRISGLRSFSKMSAFDFAMTVAVGSLMASTALSKNPPLFQAVLALAGLYATQMLIAYLRVKEMKFISVVDNRPLLLMNRDGMKKQNMKQAHVTYDDVLQKLREANVIHFDQIEAVIFETTGDISVLHNKNKGSEHFLDVRLIENVKGAEETVKERSDNPLHQ